MKALILAAGYGTRLKVLGENTPKALLPINGIPIIDCILQRIEVIEDLDEVLVVTNNKFFTIFEKWAQSKKGFKCAITVVNDGTNSSEERLGSIGDIEFVLKQRNIKEDILVVGGDNLFDFDLAAYSQQARQATQAITMGVYDIHDLEEAKLFGVVALDDAGKVSSFEEKPAQPKSSLIAMCFYYIPQAALSTTAAYLQQTEKSDTAGDYIRWVREKNDVYGFKFTGKWYDIGSVESYHEAQKDFSS